MKQRPAGQLRESAAQWLGPLPASWPVVPLKHRTSYVSRGLSPDYSEDEAGTPVVSQACIYWDGLRTDRVKWHRGFPTQGRGVLRPGDLLVNSTGTGTLGRAAIFREACRTFVADTHVTIVRPGSDTCANFLRYIFQTEVYQGYIYSVLALGATNQIELSREGLRATPVPMPSLPEQRTIAAFLDRKTAAIDTLIAKKERQIGLLGEKRQALITQAVTKGLDPNVPMRDSGVEWLGKIPAHWRSERIATVSTKITNGFVGPTRDILVDQGVRYLQSLHIKGNQIRFTEENEYYVKPEWSRSHGKSVLNEGDVLVVQTGDIGQVACVPPEFEGSNCHALIIISPVTSVLRGPYLSWTLNSVYGQNSLKAIQTGALHPHLNCTFVREVVVPIPPLTEQEGIMEFFGQEDSATARLQDQNRIAVDLLREYRQALISAAVTGKIDIPAEEAA